MNEKELSVVSFDPKEIQQKLEPSENMALYITVKTYVATYYVKLREIMMNADKRGSIDYDEVQDQMRAIYKRMKKTKKSKPYFKSRNLARATLLCRRKVLLTGTWTMISLY